MWGPGCCAACRPTGGRPVPWPAGPGAWRRFRASTPCRATSSASDSLEAALEGCHTAYYLVHSMEADGRERVRRRLREP